MNQLKLVDGEAVGAWIEPQLSWGPGALVREQIPGDYNFFLRILHPVTDSAGASVSWSDVARATGRTPHREMQWHSIVGSAVPHSLAGAEWVGPRPCLGELEQPDLGVLSAIVADHTKHVDDCFFGFSMIYPEVEEAGPGSSLLKFPRREFVVLEGPLAHLETNSITSEPGADEMTAGSNDAEGGDPLMDVFWGRAPNLMWPIDREWYVASEIDFDSTLVGGSKSLIEELMAETRLETWVMEPSDSLAEDADRINQ